MSLVVGPQPKITIGRNAGIRVGPSVTIGPTIDALVGPRPAVVIEPLKTARLVIEPMRAATVQPPQRAAWDERGWARRNENGQQTYEGPYQVISKSTGERLHFQGRVVTRGSVVTAYIADPPPEIKRHRHGACFQLFRAPWFQLHWSRPARNIDDAILYMERVLDESFNG